MSRFARRSGIMAHTGPPVVIDPGPPDPPPVGQSGFPDATNTGFIGAGLVAGDLTTIGPGDGGGMVSGVFASSSTNQTITGKRIKGNVTISHSGVSFVNCWIEGKATGTAQGMIETAGYLSNATFSYCKIGPDDEAGTTWTTKHRCPNESTRYAIGSAGVTIDHCNIYGYPDGFRGGGGGVATITNNYFHDLAGRPLDANGAGASVTGLAFDQWDHCDHIQIRAGTTYVITGNTFEATVWRPPATVGQTIASSVVAVQSNNINSCIIILRDFAGGFDINGCTITGNRFNAGNYTIYFARNSTSWVKPINGTISGNRFMRTVFTKGGRNGLLQYSTAPTWGAGNVWDDDDTTIAFGLSGHFSQIFG